MLIDITRLADRHLNHRLPTGVDRVSLAYLQHYGDRAYALIRFAGRWLEFNRQQSAHLFEALQVDDASARSMIRWTVARAYAQWASKMPARLLLNTGHSGLDQADYRRWLQRRHLRPVFFLHDLIPLSHPEYCRPGEAERHRLRLATMLSMGRGLIVNSQATRNEVMCYAKDLAQPLPPLAVAPLAPGDLPPADPLPPLDRPYFVVLGTIEPRKNHLLLLHVWRQLAARCADQTPALVVIGQRGWECEQVVDLLERCAALKPHVIELSRCTDQALATWLGHARALLFPSFIEGFGMPLVEALRHRVPVIASDLPVFREIAGDFPVYLDPLDGPRWAATILDYADSQSRLRAQQCQRISSFVPPSWAAHFSQVDAFLAGLLSDAESPAARRSAC